jgi:hypothetical protein
MEATSETVKYESSVNQAGFLQLQLELAQRPKCLLTSFSEFKFDSPTTGKSS